MDTQQQLLGCDDGQYKVPSWEGPKQVLKYLARYTHRVAISNQRLVDLVEDKVRFHWKDYAHAGVQKTMTLKATEFIRRFLLHVLPSGFVRIRHYGFLANRVCQEKLERCRNLLGVETTPEPTVAPNEAIERRPEAHICPACEQGRMVVIEILQPARIKRAVQVEPEMSPERVAIDTS